MQQFVQATDLKPGSIYLAFDNKEGLFREALDSYTQQSIIQIRNTRGSAISVGEGICLFLESIIQESTREIIAVVFSSKPSSSWLLREMNSMN